jgi:hypothetical protein
MTLQEFKVSLRKFCQEVVTKPCKPLGMGMFTPWKSGNWKEAFQQWLVIHLYAASLCSIHVPYLIPVYFFCTWILWFALTQRKRSALPALFWGIQFGCFVGVAGLVGLTYSQDYLDDGVVYVLKRLVVVVLYGAPSVAFLSTSCYFIEHTRPIVFLGFVLMALSSCMIIGLCMHFLATEGLGVAIALNVLSVITNLPSFYLGTSLFMIGMLEDTELAADSVEKRVVHIESKSTTDEENPAGGSNNEAIIAQVRVGKGEFVAG